MKFDELLKTSYNGDLFRPVEWKGSAKCFRTINGEIYLLDKMEVINAPVIPEEDDWEFVVRGDLVEEIRLAII